MTKEYLKKIVILLYICPLLGANGFSIPLGPLTSITTLPHIWHPTLFLAFSVNATELQLYVDPQLKVYKPFHNDTAYLLLALSNTTIPPQLTFADAEIFTIVNYTNALYRMSLNLYFNNLLASIGGNIYSPASYGYKYAPNMFLILNEAFHAYQFTMKNDAIQLNTSITWNPNEQIDFTAIQTNLASILLSPTVHDEYASSIYKYGAPTYPRLPILRGLWKSYKYDQPLHPCTLNYFYSTFIQTVLFPISTVSNSPVFCAFTLQRSTDITSITQIDLNY